MDEYSPHSQPPSLSAFASATGPEPDDSDRWALRINEPGRPERLAEWHDRPVDSPQSSSQVLRGYTLRVVQQPSDAPGAPAPTCTFYRGATGPRVRAWSETLLLNGQAVVDAEIQPGDRLAIGNLEFELTETPTSGAPRQRDCQPFQSPSPADEIELASTAAHEAAIATAHDAAEPPPSGRAVDIIPPREHDDSDESVEAHLERLLKRVCGEDAARDFARQRDRNSGSGEDRATVDPTYDPTGDSERFVPQSDATWSRRPETRGPSVRSTGTTGTTAPDDDTPFTDARRTPLVPAAAPLHPRDVQADWSGLRQLANESARAAIETHQMKGVARSARSRLSAAVLFAVSGTIGLYVIPGDQWLPLLGVLAAYGTTVLWLLRTLRGSRVFRHSPSR